MSAGEARSFLDRVIERLRANGRPDLVDQVRAIARDARPMDPATLERCVNLIKARARARESERLTSELMARLKRGAS